MNNKKSKNLYGFTLVELLVSVSIIVIMTGIFLANYHSENQRNNLSAAAQLLASNIRLCQSYSLGSKKLNEISPDGGWGISVTENVSYYKIFIYDDDNDQLTEYRKINLPKNIVIENFDIMRVDGNVFSNRSAADINFEPPDPITHINASGIVNGQWIKISLRDMESNQQKTVLVNFFGLVEVLK